MKCEMLIHSDVPYSKFSISHKEGQVWGVIPLLFRRHSSKRPTSRQSWATDPGVWTCSRAGAVSPNPEATSSSWNHPRFRLWRFCAPCRGSRPGFYTPGPGTRGVFPQLLRAVSRPPTPDQLSICIAYKCFYVYGYGRIEKRRIEEDGCI